MDEKVETSSSGPATKHNSPATEMSAESADAKDPARCHGAPFTSCPSVRHIGEQLSTMSRNLSSLVTLIPSGSVFFRIFLGGNKKLRFYFWSPCTSCLFF